MSAHTPGPWTLDCAGNVRIIRQPNGMSLMGDEQYYPWCPDSDADWQLISAAPDMLAALKAYEALHPDSLAMARAAIAKAEAR